MVEVSAIQNGDGTATITISGTDEAADNEVLYCRIGDQYWHLRGHAGSSSIWRSAGARIGDGTVDASVGKGGFWFTVSSGGEFTTPMYVAVTDGADPVVDQIMCGIRDRLILLELPGIDPARITTHAIIDQQLVGKADGGDRILIGPAAGEVLATTGPLQSDDIEYPIAVAHISAANQKQSTEERRRWQNIRQRIRQSFINQPLVIPEGLVWRCQMRSVDPIARDWWDKNAMVSPQVLVFSSREPRGL